MKTQTFVRHLYIIISIVFIPSVLAAQIDPWPKIIEKDEIKITVYQPQPESLDGNLLKVRAAFSAKNTTMKDPVFGVMWADVRLNTDRDNRMATLDAIKIVDLRLPAYPDSGRIAAMANIIETDAQSWNLEISLDRLLVTLDQNKQADELATEIKNAPPKILIASKPTVLVLIDGEPKFADYQQTGLRQVVNTPFFILNDPGTNSYYLNGDGIWYVSSSITNSWSPTEKLPAAVNQVALELEKAGSIPLRDTVNREHAQDIIVSTQPAELIQYDGEPDFASIKGTELLYLRNSQNNVFLDMNSQQYFVLIAGRWYKASSLTGNWNYVASDQLPNGFKNIPVGSEKDIVLASVAGTTQANDALRDAQIPQTAVVDRKSASTSVTYDGDPQFEKIQGTDDLYYSPNTSGIVLREGTKYYAVDNGVWFESDSPGGPWQVAVERPDEVERIPPSSPAYNVKYVYVYDYTPDVVYVGYTPGYLGSYIIGPTIVYGTGWYYNPWWGNYFYPRPYTYGFNMFYNPWSGWSFGMSFNFGGWFYMPYGYYYNSWYGGWWGPPFYHPPYHHWCNHYYGENPYYSNNNYYYGPRNTYSGNTKPAFDPVEHVGPNAANGTGNLYINRPGISSSTINTGDGSGSLDRPGSLGGKDNNVSKPNDARPGTSATTIRTREESVKNNVYTDQHGNIYKGRDDVWKQYNGNRNKWTKPGAGNITPSKPSSPSAGDKTQIKPATSNTNAFDRSQLQKQQQQRDQGQQRNQSFKQYQQGTQRQPKTNSAVSRPETKPK